MSRVTQNVKILGLQILLHCIRTLYRINIILFLKSTHNIHYKKKESMVYEHVSPHFIILNNR